MMCGKNLMAYQSEQVKEKTDFIVNYQFINGSAYMYALANGYSINSGSTVAAGSLLEFNVYPDPGYRVMDWTINGVAQNFDGQSLVINNVQENLDVIAILEEFVYPEIYPTYQFYVLSNPQGAVFAISYGSTTGITSISRYEWDEENNQSIATPLQLNTDYTLSTDGDSLTILASYFQAQNPQLYDSFTFIVEFTGGITIWINVFVVEFDSPTFSPNQLSFDLTNPIDLSCFIIYADAFELTSLTLNNAALQPNIDYKIEGTWLFIKQGFLTQHLQNQGQSIVLVGHFDNGSTAQLTITSTQTGVINATLNPTSALINQSEIENGGYIDITINWNDASAVTGMMVKMANYYGVEQFPWYNYVVTNNNNGTANLRIYFDEGDKKFKRGKEQAYYQYITIEVAFNQGASANFYLTMYAIYYDVNVEIFPPDAGFVDGTWNYRAGELVTLNAYSNFQYIFLRWEDEEGNILGTETTLSFIMPARDLNFKAYFARAYQITYGTNSANGTVQAYYNGQPLNSFSMVPEGASVLFVATPNEGYMVSNWYVQNQTINYNGLEYLIPNITSDINVVVNFTQIPANYHMISYSVIGGNGTLNATFNNQPLPSGGVVAAGSSVTFTANPNTNYRVKEWKINNNIVENNTGNELLVENITSGVNVTVEFVSVVSIGGSDTLADVNIFPNPFNDVLSIDSNVKISNLTITNIVGQVVKYVDHPTNIVDTRDLSSGIYIIVLETSSGNRIVKKLLKR